MNDQYFEQWAEILPEIRQKRIESVKARTKGNSANLKAKDFFDIFVLNFDDLLNQWWGFEKKTWQESPTEDLDLASENLKNELDSVIEFEMNAMEGELNDLRQEITWNDEDIEKGKLRASRFAADVKSKYALKIEKLLKKSDKVIPPPVTSSRVASRAVSGGSGTSGASIFMMFLLGLLLGLGAAYYFWDANKRVAESYEIKLKNADVEKKEIIDSMTILSETYIQLVNGRILNIPQLKSKIDPIKKSFEEKRGELNAQYKSKEQNLRKRIPAGDRLDRSLAQLEEAHKSEMAELDSQEKARLEQYRSQLEMHSELLNQSHR